MLDATPKSDDVIESAPLTTNTGVFLEDNFENLSISFSEREVIRDHTPKGVIVDITGGGIPTLTINGIPLYNEASPIEGVKRQVDLIEAEDDANLVVIMGLGLGYHAEQLERRFTCPILIYEPSLDILATTLSQRTLPLRRSIVVSDIPHLLVETQARLQFNDRKLVVAAILEYQQLFKTDFETFKNTMSQAISNAQILENTTAIRSQDWIYHAAENTPKAADRHTIEVLGERFRNRPGILVSAGPSLDKNLESLKAASGKALIVSVNAAATPLEKAGIRPDIIAVVEGLDLRAQLEDLPFLEEVSLAPTLNCFPGFFDLPAKHIFPIADFSVTCSDWFSKAYSWQQMPSGGSVACTVFSILYTLGCDPIILVGQDLAYTNGQSYASSATFGKQTMQYDPENKQLKAVEAERNKTIEEIRTKGGLSVLDNLNAVETEAWGGDGVVYSIGIFNLFRSWFETAAESWARERTLINATEGGARINGFEELTLEEAIAKHCRLPFDAAGSIDDAVAKAEENNIDVLVRIIEKDLETIQRIIALSKEARGVADEAIALLETAGVGEAEPTLRRLSYIENEVRALTRENRIVDTFVSGKANKIRMARWQDKDEDHVRQSQNALRRTGQLFDVIDEGATELLSLFRPVLKKVTEKMG
jgi:hypothetical protein